MATYTSYVIMQWDAKQFYVGSHDLYPFFGLEFEGGVNTETKEQGNKLPKIENKSKKNNPLSFSIALNRLWNGKNVKKEAMWWVNKANTGEISMLYLGKSPLTKTGWKLSSAKVHDVKLISNGKDTLWNSCQVDVSFVEVPLPMSKSKMKKQMQKRLKKAAGKKVSAKVGKATRTRRT